MPQTRLNARQLNSVDATNISTDEELSDAINAHIYDIDPHIQYLKTTDAILTVNSKGGNNVVLDKTDIGLGYVDNTADIDKPVSTPMSLELAGRAVSAATDASNKANAAQAAAIAASAPIAHVGSGGTSHANVVAGGASGFMTGADKTKLNNITGTNTGDQVIPTTLPASDVYAWAKAATKPTYTNTEVGLGNVNNTSDADKPVSTAQATALSNKVNWSDVGAPNGPASLNATGVLLISQVPLMHKAIQIPATSGTTQIPYDNTVPLNTEGTQILTTTFNPLSNTSKMVIQGAIQVDSSAATRTFTLALFRNTTCIGVVSLNFITLAKAQILPFCFSDLTLGTLFGNTVTYSLRIGVNSNATWYVNRAATQVYGGMQAYNSVLFSEFN